MCQPNVYLNVRTQGRQRAVNFEYGNFSWVTVWGFKERVVVLVAVGYVAAELYLRHFWRSGRYGNFGKLYIYASVENSLT